MKVQSLAKLLAHRPKAVLLLFTIFMIFIGSQATNIYMGSDFTAYLPSEDPLEMEFIGLTSLSMCSANSFLPWMNVDGLRPDAEIPEEFIRDEIVDEKTGRLNSAKLHKKLRDLAQERQYARAIR